jgi:hypothetical protein
MNRILLFTGIAAAACIAAAAPAVAGLSGNPSFSHDVPVSVPSQAQLVQFDDHGRVRGSDDRARTPTSTPTATRHGEPEPGDDRGAATEPGDDRGTATEPGDDRGATTEPGDDRGATTEPGDDTGSDTPTVAVTSEPGDDSGRDTATSGSSGGSDDGGR